MLRLRKSIAAYYIESNTRTLGNLRKKIFAYEKIHSTLNTISSNCFADLEMHMDNTSAIFVEYRLQNINISSVIINTHSTFYSNIRELYLLILRICDDLTYNQRIVGICINDQTGFAVYVVRVAL